MSLKLVSLNIEGDKHLERVQKLLTKEDADIVCLQECFEDRLEMLAGQEYPYRSYTPGYLSDQNGVFRKWGEVILSKYPMVSQEIHYLKTDDYGPQNLPKAGIDNHVPVLVMAEIKGVMIGTIHFTWTPRASVTQRQREHLEQLLNIIKSREVVLVGDFNIPRGNEMYLKLAAILRDNIPSEVETTVDPDLHYANKEKRGKLKLVVDYVWSTPKYRVDSVRVVTSVSDHCALICKVGIRERWSIIPSGVKEA